MSNRINTVVSLIHKTTDKMKVISKIFGTGTVISQDTKTVQVDFNGQVKNLMLKFANLTNEDGTVFYIEPKKVSKPKTSVLPKIDYSKYSDAELLRMHNELLGGLTEAKKEARGRCKVGTF